MKDQVFSYVVVSRVSEKDRKLGKKDSILESGNIIAAEEVTARAKVAGKLGDADFDSIDILIRPF